MHISLRRKYVEAPRTDSWHLKRRKVDLPTLESASCAQRRGASLACLLTREQETKTRMPACGPDQKAVPSDSRLLLSAIARHPVHSITGLENRSQAAKTFCDLLLQAKRRLLGGSLGETLGRVADSAEWPPITKQGCRLRVSLDALH